MAPGKISFKLTGSPSLNKVFEFEFEKNTYISTINTFETSQLITHRVTMINLFLYKIVHMSAILWREKTFASYIEVH